MTSSSRSSNTTQRLSLITFFLSSSLSLDQLRFPPPLLCGTSFCSKNPTPREPPKRPNCYFTFQRKLCSPVICDQITGETKVCVDLCRGCGGDHRHDQRAREGSLCTNHTGRVVTPFSPLFAQMLRRRKSLLAKSETGLSKTETEHAVGITTFHTSVCTASPYFNAPSKLQDKQYLEP